MVPDQGDEVTSRIMISTYLEVRTKIWDIRDVGGEHFDSLDLFLLELAFLGHSMNHVGKGMSPQRATERGNVSKRQGDDERQTYAEEINE